MKPSVRASSVEGLRQELKDLRRQVQDLHRDQSWQYDVDPGTDTIDATAGQALITEPSNSVDVEHGLPFKPDRGAIAVAPASVDAAASDWWLSSFTATTFRINLSAAPPVGPGALFDWHAHDVPAPAVAGYPAEVLADNPLGYWRLGESTGTVALNEVAGGAELLHVGSVTLGQPGAISDGDFCASYPGTYANRSRLETNPGMGVSNVTIEAWAHFAPPQKGAVAFIGGGNDRGYGFGIGSGDYATSGSTLIGVFEGVRWINTGVTLTAGWHHIVMTISAGTARFYLDGVLVHTSAGTAPIPPGEGDDFVVGGYEEFGGARWFAGRIDEPAIYASALSTARIEAHFAAA